MIPYEDSILGPETPIQNALRSLESSISKIVLIVDGDRRLLGTVTDGDIRRGILRGVPLDAAVENIMNREPVTATVGDDSHHMMQVMHRGGYRQIPLVDGDGRIVGVESLDHLLELRERDNWVVIMAGGFGKRLQPLTDNSVKPMLKIGRKPILETIVENFADSGFHRFLIAVHYRADDIIEHFGDGSRFGVEIEYISEQEPMGTAGALRLLPERPSEPLLVMNGDILTKVNFGQLLDFHKDYGASATMCVRDYDLRVPFGVVEVEEHRFRGITEKPVQKFFVNAGIYALEPETLDFIPAQGRLDMPDLFASLQEAERQVTVFPIREYWMDIGQHDDLSQARSDFFREFED